MKRFMDEETFLLNNETAKLLYHDYASNLPIIDYHCHLDPQAIAENRGFESITEIWLAGDHYKWRAMRTFGIKEAYITGNRTDEEKFQAWAKTLPYTIGNPLLHWSAMELKKYFGVEEQLSSDSWRDIYDICNRQINSEGFHVKKLLTDSNVEWICTTDDPTDALQHHKAIAGSAFSTSVTPTFRPDRLLRIDREDYNEYIEHLGESVGFSIDNFPLLVDAIMMRMDYFHANGCFISDHAFTSIPFARATDKELSAIFTKKLANLLLSDHEVEQYTTELLLLLGRKYAELGWTMQLHIGAARDPNTRMLQKLGSDSGFDFIGDWNFGEKLALFMNELEYEDKLPKTIFYNLNAVHNDMLATLAGSFQKEGIKGKVQFGTAWWFNDQKDGMEKQLNSLSNFGLLSTFVGMLTDSRSFLSYPRHDYFRRILCNLIGTWVESGEAPNDKKLLGKIVQDISYNNAFEYFRLGERK
ncbi:glucuronate isomerase [Niallia taxi]|uniref:glucuronate isomerase n=1 Tax=Niallia taxi TaxID=2499688 RepID=UPI002E204CCB|nr:glucuronate isomerase [Niallia taxi]